MESIGYEPTEWKDDEQGATPIDAAKLNKMESGIADACAAADELRGKRLVTYMVAQDGKTATQDVYEEPIVGPCLVLDLKDRATYYDPGDGSTDDGGRTLITSGADIDGIRDSLSLRSETMALGYTVKRVGPMAMLYFWDWETPDAITNDYQLGTLPEWAVPGTAVSVPSIVKGYWIVIERDGRARFQKKGSDEDIAKGVRLFWTFSYMIA